MPHNSNSALSFNCSSDSMTAMISSCNDSCSRRNSASSTSSLKSKPVQPCRKMKPAGSSAISRSVWMSPASFARLMAAVSFS